MQPYIEKNRGNLPQESFYLCCAFEISNTYLQKSDYSKAKYKALSLDIMDGVRNCGDIDTMNVVSNIVARWGVQESEWISDIIEFSKGKEDIEEFFVGENDLVKDVILIVDDTTEEHILDYNEFLFNIRDKYDEIHDFMVIDECMKSAINAMYNVVSCIYKRG